VSEPTPEKRRRRSRRGGRRRRRGGRPPVVEAAAPPEPEAKKRVAKPRRPRAKPVEFPPESRQVAATAAAAALRLGIEQLHPEQEQVVADVLAQRDVLLVLPTGFGKSACYQVPSMLLPKPVVVVSPLVALLQDQHLRLVAKGIRCVRLDGTVRGPARRAAMAEIAAGGPLLVMTTRSSRAASRWSQSTKPTASPNGATTSAPSTAASASACASSARRPCSRSPRPRRRWCATRS
jgi:hypothetical protein